MKESGQSDTQLQFHR